MLILIGILFGTALALAFPGPVLWLRPILQPGFAATMFFVGTLVRPEQVRVFRRNRARTLLGLLVQYTVMPLTAWAISCAFDEPMVRVGVILVGCMPGAMASNVMTLLLRGDLILSVTMTTVATLTCPLILAFWLPLLADTRLEVPVAALAWSAVWMVVLPVAAGIVTRHLKAKIPGWWNRAATRDRIGFHRADYSRCRGRQPGALDQHRPNACRRHGGIEPVGLFAGVRRRQVAALAGPTAAHACH